MKPGCQDENRFTPHEAKDRDGLKCPANAAMRARSAWRKRGPVLFKVSELLTGKARPTGRCLKPMLHASATSSPGR